MTRKDLPDPGVDDADASETNVSERDLVDRDLDDADTGPIASIDAILGSPAPVSSTVGDVDGRDRDALDRDAFELELDSERTGAGPLSDVPLYDHTADGDPLGPPVIPSSGSHRHREGAGGDDAEGSSVRSWQRAVPVALLAVGAVVVGIAVADLWPSSGSSTPTATAPVAQVTASSVALPGVLAGSATPAGGAASTGTVAASASASPKPAAGTASVTVLNQTSVKDLGATEAGKITAAGWYVRRVTDVNARETVTTVFYDTGQEDQAQQLIRTVPTVHRAEPRPLWLLRTGGLIVVVADDAA